MGCVPVTFHLCSDPQESVGFRASYLREPGVYKPLAIGVLLMFFQQATGINAIMFYAENIFKEAQFEVSGVGVGQGGVGGERTVKSLNHSIRSSIQSIH